jgi:rare lipoprotein A (peptidoglycan hydrolase)
MSATPGSPTKPLHDPIAPPERDPPNKPMHDPPGDPTFEPPQPLTEPTPNPASDPPPEMPGDPSRDKLLASPDLSQKDHWAETGRSSENSGIASVYSGQHAASGERTKTGELTAAHRTLPFGTKVTVVNRGNGRSAVVRINDRVPSFADG